jgi:CHASE2 domain-containing sensor protein
VSTIESAGLVNAGLAPPMPSHVALAWLAVWGAVAVLACAALLDGGGS